MIFFWTLFYFASLQSLIIKRGEKKYVGVYGTNWNSLLKWMFEVIQPDTSIVQLLVCENSNATSGFIKCREFLDQLRDCQLLK